MRLAVVTSLVLASLLAGCGGEASDLLAVDRAGSGAGARLRLVVRDDGTVLCNGGGPRRLPDPLLLDARELERDLHDAAVAGTALAPGPASVLRYRIQTQSGRLRFADDSPRQPAAFFRAAYLVRRIAKGVCLLPR